MLSRMTRRSDSARRLDGPSTVSSSAKRAAPAIKAQIINGMKKGMVTRALDGEDVGTVIYQD